MRVPTRVPLKISQGSPRREAFDLPRRPLWNARRGIWVFGVRVLGFGVQGFGFGVLAFWGSGFRVTLQPNHRNRR